MRTGGFPGIIVVGRFSDEGLVAVGGFSGQDQVPVGGFSNLVQVVDVRFSYWGPVVTSSLQCVVF